MILVSLYDAKAETWSNPHCCQNKFVALREFGDLVNDPRGTLVSEHPADFDLYQCGEFDDPFGGVITALKAPIHLANGNDVKRLSGVDGANSHE